MYISPLKYVEGYINHKLIWISEFNEIIIM